MRAHGKQKTGQKPGAHTKQKQAHGQQTNQQPCAKQEINTQIMRKLTRHMFTQDTAQDIT